MAREDIYCICTWLSVLVGLVNWRRHGLGALCNVNYHPRRALLDSDFVQELIPFDGVLNRYYLLDLSFPPDGSVPRECIGWQGSEICTRQFSWTFCYGMFFETDPWYLDDCRLWRLQSQFTWGTWLRSINVFGVWETYIKLYVENKRGKASKS